MQNVISFRTKIDLSTTGLVCCRYCKKRNTCRGKRQSSRIRRHSCQRRQSIAGAKLQFGAVQLNGPGLQVACRQSVPLSGQRDRKSVRRGFVVIDY